MSFLLAPVGRANNGLTLVNAVNVFLIEQPACAAVELQCVNRVHRVGQTRPTTVYRYVIKDTVEDAMLAMAGYPSYESTRRHCPVIENGVMVGMLSIRDIKKAVAEAAEAADFVPHVVEWRQEQSQPHIAAAVPAFAFSQGGAFL